MKKHDVCQRKRGSAEFVIAHATWQRSRGRRPSESFMGVRSPELALRLAQTARSLKRGNRRGDHYCGVLYGPVMPVQKSVVSLNVSSGSMVADGIKDAVAVAAALRAKVQIECNGILVEVTARDNPVTLYQKWEREMDRRAAEYRRSPEGRRAAAEAAARLQSYQQQMDRLMEELPNLDFSDMGALIDWLDRLADPSDHIGVPTPAEEIVSAFIEHGFVPNANTKGQFNGDDPENYARWLIGQALDGLNTMGAIHGVYHKFAKEWKEKFAASTPS